MQRSALRQLDRLFDGIRLGRLDDPNVSPRGRGSSYGEHVIHAHTYCGSRRKRLRQGYSRGKTDRWPGGRLRCPRRRWRCRWPRWLGRLAGGRLELFNGRCRVLWAWHVRRSRRCIHFCRGRFLISSLPRGPVIRAPGKRHCHAEDQQTAYEDVHSCLRSFAWKSFRQDHSSENQLITVRDFQPIEVFIPTLARFWQ